jgi:C1A family cysteine protease
LLVVMAFLAACNNDSDPKDPFGNSSDPIPDRARMVSADEYAKLATDPRFYAIGPKTLAQQAASAAAAEAHDDRAIRAFEQAHGALAPLVPAEPSERQVTRQADGSYKHLVRLADGRETPVVTLSRRWGKSNIAGALASFATRENQLSFYRVLYEAMPEAARAELGLPDPSEIHRAPKKYTASAIRRLNDRIVEHRDRMNPIPASDERTALACGLEEGAASGSDLADGPGCVPRPDGLFARHAFGAKSHLSCVKSQANRGSCVAFAVTSATEMLVDRKSGRRVNLSEQSLYAQAKLVWQRGDRSDGLNTQNAAAAVVGAKWPLPFENTQAYNPSWARQQASEDSWFTQSCDGYGGTCSDSSHQSELVCADQPPKRYCGFMASSKPETGFTLSDVSEAWDSSAPDASLARVKAALDAGAGVVWSMWVTPGFDAAAQANGYASYNGPREENRGGHALHIVGYVDNGSLSGILPGAPLGAGGGYLIIKNSWGSCWGDGGYAYVPYDFVRAYTQDTIVLAGGNPLD